jgi:hypothetical protein
VHHIWLAGIIGVGLAAALVGLGALVARRQPERRARRAVDAVPAVPLGGVADGQRAHVRGVARLGTAVRTSPFTGRSCIGYRFIAEVRGDEDWSTVHEEWRCDPFELVDDGVSARVEGPFVFGMAAIESSDGSADVSAEMIVALHAALVDTTLPLGGPRRFRYREARLEEGDFVSVLGEVSSVEPTSTSATGPRRRLIRGSEKRPVFVVDGDVIAGLQRQAGASET